MTPIQEAFPGEQRQQSARGGLACVEVRIYPDADTEIEPDAYDNDMPVVRISVPGVLDLQIRPEANTQTGQAELVAAEKLADVAMWYRDAIRALVRRNEHEAVAESACLTPTP